MEMELRENVSLAEMTTFRLGGVAKVVITCTTVEDIKMALATARERHLSWYVIGGGSNMLVSDAGYGGVIIHIALPNYSFAQEENTAHIGTSKEGVVVAVAEAGVTWDSFVQESVSRELWGLENLAGIPGTVGAAPVQNIGAYGVETCDTLAWVEALHTGTNELQRFTNDQCGFGYRESFFKHHPEYILVRAAFNLSTIPNPRISYADIAAKQKEGVSLHTPQSIADVVREIRLRKFPDLSKTGTAGSFFKNPVISKERFEELRQMYADLPGYVSGDEIKVSLAWILDKALQLKGFSHGSARLFEKQPLVLVAEEGSTASDVEALVAEVSKKVLAASGIVVEREVRSLS
jgi:UDP-N-acetylmuramate dehydrogenase